MTEQSIKLISIYSTMKEVEKSKIEKNENILENSVDSGGEKIKNDNKEDTQGLMGEEASKNIYLYIYLLLLLFLKKF